MAFCSACGKKNSDAAKFCEYCGNRMFDPDQTWSAGEERYSFRQEEGSSYSQPSYSYEEEDETYRQAYADPDQDEDMYAQDAYEKAPVQSSGKRREEKTGRSKKKRGFRMKTSFIVILAELLIFVLAIVGGIYLGNSLTGPQKTAEKYLSASLSGAWTDSYRYLDIPAASGLQEEDYVNAMKNTAVGTVTNLQITDRLADVDAYAEQLENTLGQLGIEVPQSEAAAAEDVKYYYATCYVDGQYKEINLTLKKTGEKKYFLFDEWKVDGADLYGTDVAVTIPAEVTLTMNGEAIAESYLQTGSGEGQKEYLLPALFYGQYFLEFTEDNCGSHREVMEYQAGSGNWNFGDLKLQPTSEETQKVFDQLVTDWPDLIGAALNGNDFSLIQDYFCTDSVADGSARIGFESQCDSAYTAEKGYGYTAIELSNIGAIPEECSGTEITLSVTAKVTRQYTRDGSSELEESDFSDYITYRLENGVWKLTSYPRV